MDEKEMKNFIDSYVEKYGFLYIKLTSSFWEAQTTGSKEAFEEYEKISNQIADLHSSKEDFEKIKKFLEEELNPKVKRQLEILYNSHLVYQGDPELIKKIISKEVKIERNFNIFRAEINGQKLTDNEIKKILRTSKDSREVQEAWEASKKQGEIVEKDLLEVVKLRNQLARSLGFENYYVMSLVASEQTPEEIQRIFEELDFLTEKAFREVKNEINNFLSKKFGASEEELKPWHYQDLFFQDGPEIYDFDLDDFYRQDILKIAKGFYKGIGMDVEKILERSSLYEKEGKCQHAFAIDMNREKDVRILQNVKNNERWMSITLHELGHAIYWMGINSEEPFLLRETAHTFVTESIAMLFGRMSKNFLFVKKYSTDFSESNLELPNKFWKILKLDQLVTCRWYQVMVNFERELYKNPDQDLNKLWWGFVKKFQLIDFYRDKPDWASKIHLSTAPVYYHNYMLGEMLASQLHNKITKEILNKNSLINVDYSDSLRVGSFLKEEIFEQGMNYKWDELVEKATGEKLTSRYFVEEFAE